MPKTEDWRDLYGADEIRGDAGKVNPIAAAVVKRVIDVRGGWAPRETVVQKLAEEMVGPEDLRRRWAQDALLVLVHQGVIVRSAMRNRMGYVNAAEAVARREVGR